MDPFDRAMELRKAGRDWSSISREMGISTERLQRRLVPGFAEHRNARIRAARAEREGNRPGARASAGHVRTLDAAEATKALAQVPPDTRGRTSRLMGDPIPGRSALDRHA